MTWKWICLSLTSRMVSWYKNKIVQADVSNCMRQFLNCFGTKHTHSSIPGLKGEALFFELKFFVVSMDHRLIVRIRILICNTNLYTVICYVNLNVYDFICMNVHKFEQINLYIKWFFCTILHVQICIYKFVHINLYM
jgi:hypothetical protein